MDEITRQELYLTGPTNPIISHRWWITGRFPGRTGNWFACLACTDEEGMILWTAEFIRQFIGQDIYRLIEWGRCEIEEVETKE